MKVFTDPINRIPPLLESDIKTKIIISKLKNENRTYISYVTKNKNDNTLLSFRGCNINNRRVVFWGDYYNFGKTLLDLIIRDYKFSAKFNYTMKYYIIESGKELKTFIKQNQITNTELEIELLELWKQLKENKNIK